MTDKQIHEWVQQIPLVDTHEHFLEESTRLSGKTDDDVFPCNDWALLFRSYVRDDLHSAGMTHEEGKRFLSPDVNPHEKYRIIAPYWTAIKHTGFAQALRHTFRGLYGEDDLTEASAPRIAEKYRETVKPGFYRDIIQNRSNIEHSHVNSVERIFVKTEQPDLLLQDLSVVEFSRCSATDLTLVEGETGKRPRTLDDWLEAIDWYFLKYGSSAVATKNWNGYIRRLDYVSVSKRRAEQEFSLHVSSRTGLGPEGLKNLQDYLFRYCIIKATEYGLPVKLHTGYYAGQTHLPLDRIKRNASDLCPLLEDFPNTRFVLMHIGYPYADEYVALAKHYHNAFIDLCWAWIISPVVCGRFLKHFLTAAPLNKVLAFGGDYIPVEPVYGHAIIARRGIAQVFSELVREGWIAREEVKECIERIMNRNAKELFSHG